MKLSKTSTKNSGFTLIELLVVIAIIGILSSVVLASLSGARESARIAAAKQFEHNIRASISDCSEAFYNFEGDSSTTVREASGYSGRDGTINGDPTRVDSLDGLGQAMEFDRSSDEAVTHPEISFADTEEHTYGAWVRWEGGQPNDYVLPFGEYGENGDTMYFMSSGNDLLRLRNSAGDTQTVGTYSTNIYDGDWHHVLWKVEDDRTVSFYINGEKQASSQVSDTSIAYTGISLGYSTGKAYGWNGEIDNVRLYSCSFE